MEVTLPDREFILAQVDVREGRMRQIIESVGKALEKSGVTKEAANSFYRSYVKAGQHRHWLHVNLARWIASDQTFKDCADQVDYLWSDLQYYDALFMNILQIGRRLDLPTLVTPCLYDVYSGAKVVNNWSELKVALEVQDNEKVISAGLFLPDYQGYKIIDVSQKAVLFGGWNDIWRHNVCVFDLDDDTSSFISAEIRDKLTQMQENAPVFPWFHEEASPGWSELRALS